MVAVKPLTAHTTGRSLPIGTGSQSRREYRRKRAVDANFRAPILAHPIGYTSSRRISSAVRKSALQQTPSSILSLDDGRQWYGSSWVYVHQEEIPPGNCIAPELPCRLSLGDKSHQLCQCCRRLAEGRIGDWQEQSPRLKRPLRRETRGPRAQFSKTSSLETPLCDAASLSRFNAKSQLEESQRTVSSAPYPPAGCGTSDFDCGSPSLALLFAARRKVPVPN